MIKEYPCKVKENDTLIMKNGRGWTVSRTDGKYIYTKEGAQFGYRHPDIVSVETPEKKVHEEEIPAAEEPVKEPKKRKSSKKKTAKEE